MRGTLYFHLFSICLMICVCAYFAWCGMAAARRFTLGGLIALAAILVCAADIVSFVKSVIRPVTELEDTVNVLQETAPAEAADYGSGGALERKTPTELLQVLLQREAAAQIMTKQAEINALQNQINPHFLYNTLETIRGQALCCGALEIADTTKALADIFRYNISRKGAMIYLREELANIDAYMKIQRIRFDDRFELSTEIAEDTLELQIPKLLVQPVIENALKHGLEVKRGRGRIFVRAFRTEHRLEISVEDDGVGMSQETLGALNEELARRRPAKIDRMSGDNTNIGLVNINDRIKLIYGEDFGISVISAQGVGTKVALSLGIIQ